MAESKEIAAFAAKIATAYVRNHQLAVGELPGLLRSVHDTLSNLGRPAAVEPVPEKPQAAVPIKKSVTPDYIICLEDGRKLRMLKRHLATRYNLTPDEYRAKWGLPADYPMVAPNYAKQRSGLAKRIGLGRRGGGEV